MIVFKIFRIPIPELHCNKLPSLHFLCNVVQFRVRGNVGTLFVKCFLSSDNEMRHIGALLTFHIIPPSTYRIVNVKLLVFPRRLQWICGDGLAKRRSGT